MATDTHQLEAVPDTKPVRVFIPISGKTERFRASAVLTKTGSDAFTLQFQPGVLPTSVIDTAKTCLITIDLGGPSLSLEARIAKIEGEQILKMVLEKTVSHAQMREFFRVDATTSVISSSFMPEFFDQQGEPWSIKGRTIDISGSGILAVFNQPPPSDRQVRLEIALPAGDGNVISVLAHPVRTLKLEDNHYEVAYHFDDISMEDRDRIIGCCLIIQRRLLRLKVQVKDSTRL